jgi:DNA-binding CsgD family transcriptional regulator
MFDKLSPREQEIAQLVAIERHTSKEAARKLGISFRTVETHRMHIYNELGVRTIAELASRLAGERLVTQVVPVLWPFGFTCHLMATFGGFLRFCGSTASNRNGN